MSKLVKGVNDLESQFPKVAESWDYDKNDGKKPSEVFAHSNQDANWKCKKCGYSWKAKISNRTRPGKGGCPACSGKVFAKGINDLQTTHPDLAKEWDYEKNYPVTPSDVMHGTSKIYWWICPFRHKSYQKSPNKRTSQHAGCPNCKKGRQSSFAERAFFFYTQQLFPDAINRYKDIFNNGMELDVYIPSLRTGIEYDGVAFHKPDRLEREKRKYLICKENHIKLIRIKEQKLDDIWFEDIADDMYQTEYDGRDLLKLEDTIRLVLGKISFQFSNLRLDINIYRDENKIRNIDPAFFRENSLATRYPEIAKQWHPTKNGELTPAMFLCGSGYNAWWLCPVCGYEWQSQINTRVNQKTGCKQCHLQRIKEHCPNNKTIYQYSLDGKFIKEWRSISYAGRVLRVNASNISMCAKGKRPTAGGFRWSYSKSEAL